MTAEMPPRFRSVATAGENRAEVLGPRSRPQYGQYEKLQREKESAG